MGRASDNYKNSTRTPEERVQLKQAALQLQVLRSLIRRGTMDRALDMFESILANPQARLSTKSEAAKAMASAVGRALPQSPKVQVDACPAPSVCATGLR